MFATQTGFVLAGFALAEVALAEVALAADTKSVNRKASDSATSGDNKREPTKKGERGDGQAKESAAGGKESKSMSLSSALKLSDASKDQPLYITSDTLQLDSQGRLFTYRGNVNVSKGELQITADVVTGKYNQANEIDEVVCENDVVITKGDAMRATSNRAVYTVKKGTIVLTQAPEVFNKGNVLMADKVTVFINEDRSQAEGNVRVKVVKTDEKGLDFDSIKKRGLEGEKEER